MSRSLGSLKSAKAYTRKVLPLGWRNITIPNVEALKFMGSTNLEAMLAEWKILNHAYSARLKFLERNNGAYYSSYQLDEVKESLKNSEYAIKLISKILPETEPKPIFATHRSLENSFVPDETVFAVFADSAAFYPANVIEQKIDKVFVRFTTLINQNKGMVYYDSPILLKPEELDYFAKHLDYAKVYALGSGFKDADDVELFAEMAEDGAKDASAILAKSALQNASTP